MTSLAEILIIRGLMPITSIDAVYSPDYDETAVVNQLLAEGVLTPSSLASAKAAQLGLAFVELLDYPVDHAAVSLVPTAICRRYEVLPLGVSGDLLTVAMADPGNVLALDDVRAASRMRIKAVVAERSDLLAAIDKFHRADGELDDLRSVLEEENAPASNEIAVADAFEDDAPIVRFVNLLISQGIQDHASDIHIEPGELELTVRYRIDGVLHIMQKAPKNIQNGVISRLKIMADIDIAERRRPQDGRMSVRHGGRQIDLRVATLPTVWGEKIVMRILDNSATKVSISDSARTTPRSTATRTRSRTA
jgi:type IV pilus assembly protein PilB